jgi:hypothetical protein
MDHFAPNSKKIMSKYKGSHSQKNMLTMKQVRLGGDRSFRPRQYKKEDMEVMKLKKDLDELKGFKQKYLTMEQKMNNLENLMKSKYNYHI